MKTRRRLFTLLLTMTMLLALLFPCSAAEVSASDQSAGSSSARENLPYSTEYLRYSDNTGQVSREDKERLNSRALDAVKKYHFDFVVAIVRPSADQTESAENYARRLYLAGGLGYGKNQNGIAVIVVTDSEAQPAEYCVIVEGPQGLKYFSQERRDELKDAFRGDVERTETLGDGYTLAAENFFVSAIHDVKMAQAAQLGQELVEKTVNAPEKTESRAMPDWYPESWADFTCYYDPEAPQLVDTANIFTDEEEAVMLEQLRTLREKYGTDFVVFTDVSTYGLSRGVYAADYFEATGHGMGEESSGVILFICMEQGNRGWWTAAKGSVRTLFSESNLNRLDDRLEPYMKAGNYGRGVIGYLKDIDTLYRTGSAPLTLGTILLLVAFFVAGMVVSGGLVLSFLLGCMQTVKEAAHANSYLVEGSFHLRHRRDVFLYSSVSKRRRKSESSGGGGGSDYSGSYSSSSGSSWSGGGRSF